MQEKAIIKFENVYKSYILGKTKVNALRGLSLSINKGEFTALIGTSGSGKTTLLNLVGCLDNVDQGEISIDGEKITSHSEQQLESLRNHKIGFIFQHFHLIPVLNVYENVELPLTIRPDFSSAEKKNLVEQALVDVGLEKFHEHKPDQLSGGQRQRVAIARALVKKPSIILADEPTANLDSDTTRKVIDLLFDLNQKRGVTFFFCSHDEKLIKRVARVVRIQDGLIESAQ